MAPQHSTLPPLHEAWLPKEHSLHRPRHGTRQLGALICACVFFAFPVLSFVTGMRSAELENHPLATFPNPADGWAFFGDFQQWAVDNVPFRAEAIYATDAISRGLFNEQPSFDRGTELGPSGPAGGFDRRRKNPELKLPLAIEGKNSWLYYGDDITSRCNQAEDLATTIGSIRRLRDAVTASGRTFVLLVAPDKSTVVPENLPDDFPGKECTRKTTEELWGMLANEPGVVDMRAELQSWGRRLGRPVYPAQDGHWGDEGGVVMAKSLAEAIQPGVTQGWKVEPVERWQLPADLPPLIGKSGTSDGFTYALKPDGVRNLARPISPDFTSPVRLGTAAGPGTITTSVGLLGDSFTIRALRYLAASFGDLTVLHYGKVNEDAGRAAGEMLANNDVVAVELVERTIASGNSLLLEPAVVDGIASVLAAQPRR